MKPPCGKSCSERTTTCRPTCPKWAKYEAWKAEEEKRKQKRYAYRDDFFACRHITVKQRRRMWAQV